ASRYKRLRNQLNDPLFVRSGKGITPTTVGTNLHHYLSVSKGGGSPVPDAVSDKASRYKRLRNQLNDPLFVRSGKGITPTTVGTNL
ncbi:hypothetical protein QBS63_21180, partial [Cronobacter sakazakii]|nr:hypothetical protein [Cronobacter sakazakii]